MGKRALPTNGTHKSAKVFKRPMTGTEIIASCSVLLKLVEERLAAKKRYTETVKHICSSVESEIEGTGLPMTLPCANAVLLIPRLQHRASSKRKAQVVTAMFRQELKAYAMKEIKGEAVQRRCVEMADGLTFERVRCNEWGGHCTFKATVHWQCSTRDV